MSSVFEEKIDRELKSRQIIDTDSESVEYQPGERTNTLLEFGEVPQDKKGPGVISRFKKGIRDLKNTADSVEQHGLGGHLVRQPDKQPEQEEETGLFKGVGQPQTQQTKKQMQHNLNNKRQAGATQQAGVAARGQSLTPPQQAEWNKISDPKDRQGFGDNEATFANVMKIMKKYNIQPQ